MRHILSAFLCGASATGKNNVRPLDSCDMSAILSIIQKLYKKATEHGLPLDKIPIFTERFLPKDFEASMSKYLSVFSNPNVCWKDAIPIIWEVSKCDTIVKERRRRLLYKDVEEKDIKEYMDLFTHLDTTLMEWMAQLKPDSSALSLAKCHEYLKDDRGIKGETDVRFDDILLDFKCSNEEKVKAEHIVQLLAYVGLFERVHDKKINTIGIVNPLKGVATTIDISGYDKASQLLDFLLP
jgi:hypothetical protein